MSDSNTTKPYFAYTKQGGQSFSHSSARYNEHNTQSFGTRLILQPRWKDLRKQLFSPTQPDKWNCIFLM